MPIFLRDGSVISQSFMMGRKKSYFERTNQNFGKVKARVDEIIYTDDERNTTRNTNNPQVEYTCTILGGNEVGRRLYNVKSVVPLGAGSPFNSGEVIHTPFLPKSTQDKDGKNVNPPEKTTGSFVVIDRLHGHSDSTLITGTLKHPKSKSATKEDGQRYKMEYMGVGLEITKDGAFSISFGGGPKDKDGKAADESKAGGTFQISKDGTIKISDGDGQDIIIDKANKQVKLASSQSMQVSTGTDWTINVSGNAKLSAGGSLNLDGGVTQIGGGGFPAARMNDIVLGTDSQGGPINGYIAMGSGTVLIGG